MRVTVLYFAAAREIAGCRRAPHPSPPPSTPALPPPFRLPALTLAARRSEESVEAPAGCTAGQLLAQLAARHSGLQALCPSLQLALNQRYAPRDAPLADGDELALIPPISGG